MQVLLDSLASFHLHDVSCPPGQAERTHKHINYLLRRLAFRHRIPVVATKPSSVLADGSREYEPSTWAGLRTWDLRLSRAHTTTTTTTTVSTGTSTTTAAAAAAAAAAATTTTTMTTLIKVEVRHFSAALGTDRRAGTVMLRLDDGGLR
jgi:hypothetical protein